MCVCDVCFKIFSFPFSSLLFSFFFSCFYLLVIKLEHLLMHVRFTTHVYYGQYYLTFRNLQDRVFIVGRKLLVFVLIAPSATWSKDSFVEIVCI